MGDVTCCGRMVARKDNRFAEAHSAGEVIDQMLPRLVNDGTRNRRPEVVTEIRDINGAVDQFLRPVGKTGPL